MCMGVLFFMSNWSSISRMIFMESGTLCGDFFHDIIQTHDTNSQNLSPCAFLPY